MENLLYYPYINFPKSDWCIRSLLYYDHIGTIVPQKYFDEPQRYEPFMLQLIENELVIAINPLHTTYPGEISGPFIDYIQRRERKMVERRKDFFNRGNFQPKIPIIHVDKFDAEIFYQLEHAGLARRVNDDWFQLEKRTATELMTFLASVIGHKLDYLPATDSYTKRFTLASRKKKVFRTQKNNQIKREIILDELIPFPEEINILQLRDFKDRYLDLLRSFRRKIERIALDPHLNEDSDLFRELLLEMKDNKEEIASRMKERGFRGVSFGIFCAVSSAVIGLITADGATAAIGAALGVGSAINSVYDEEENVFDPSGIKYVALLDNRIRNR